MTNYTNDINTATERGFLQTHLLCRSGLADCHLDGQLPVILILSLLWDGPISLHSLECHQAL